MKSEQLKKEFADKWGRDEYIDTFNSDLNALIEAVIAERLREELINYDKWLHHRDWKTGIPTAEELVNEFLNSKQ